jgi:PIN domain nuclease of toxin-antitoxin system
VLLDTHVALWALVGDARLPKNATDLIAEPSNTVVVSTASVWEITIKHALNRGRATDMPVSGPQALAFLKAAGYELLAISAEHAAAVQSLPDLHRDPFDRLLVAQALHEPLRLITHDVTVKAYSDSFILV